MRPLHDRPLLRNTALAVLALLVVLALLQFVLGRGKELDERHQPQAFTESFDFAAGTLNDYEAYARRRLRAAHPDFGDELIANLAPFRIEPPADCPRSTTATYRSGIVLTHDVQDSPYMLRTLAEYFHTSCFLVYGLLLPDHGTRPGDLLRSSWQDWFAAQRFATRELGREVEALYLAGHGVGATLALLEASTNASVDGLVMVAPRLDVRAPPWQAALAAPLGWLFPAARWAVAAPATSAYRDPSQPWHLLTQTNGLVVSTEAALGSAAAEIPVFTVLSLEDTAVDAQAVLDFMATRTHPLSHTLVYTSGSVEPTPRISVGPTGFPQFGRLSLSHLGLIMQAADPVFGRDATGRECSHYFERDDAAYAQCMAGEADFKGEITPENLAQGVVQRISYNPDLRQLLNLLNTFIAADGRVVPLISR